MELLSEIFPGYNPLPNLILSFNQLKDENITEKEVCLGVILDSFEEAGVIIEDQDDIKTLVHLLVEYNILAFKKSDGQINLEIHDNFRKE